MRNVIFILLLFLIGGNSYAAPVSLRVPSNVGRTASGGWAASNSSVFSNGSFGANFITEVEGTSITFPQTMRTAANAASFITPLLIPGPAGLLTSAVLSWVGQYGLNYVNDKWMAQGSTAGGTSTPPVDTTQVAWTANDGKDPCGRSTGSGFTGCNFNDATQQNINSATWGYNGWGMVIDYYDAYDSVNRRLRVHIHSTIVNPGWHTYVDDYFIPSGSPAAPNNPATQSDWDRVNNSTTPIPDAALNDLAKGGVAIPLSPSVDMTPKTVPLGVPVQDAITKNYYQDRAQVTPTDANDPTKADLQVVKQQTDAAGNPVTDPNTGNAAAPAKADDPCAEHPNRVGCLEKDSVATPDITQQAKTVTITPDSGWGADTAACPADVNLNLKAPGASGVALSWAPTCQFVDKLRPVILGLAWVTAVMLAIGIARKGGA